MSRDSRRINRWVDALLRDRSPRHLRGREKDADVLRAAIDLRAAAPGAGMPDQRFVDDLHRRLAVETQGAVLPERGLSRRRLLVGGGVAVAAAAAGVVGEKLIEGQGAPGTPQPAPQLVADNGRWIAVATLDAVPSGTAVRFSTGAIEGLVVNRGGVIEALSASCTHLGCIVTFNRTAGRLDCPCHNTSFGLDGSVLFQGYALPLPPLPRLPSRVRKGSVEVLAV
ncbi:MAG: Rieske 2Fe-2S domain-containing protein [Candidatus Dormibacter sp.]